MTAKKSDQKKIKAGATELSEEEMKKAQGGWSWGETNDSYTIETNKTDPLLKADQLTQKVQKVK